VFFDEEKITDDVLGDDDLLSESSSPFDKQARPMKPDKESIDVGYTTIVPEPEISFSACLNI